MIRKDDRTDEQKKTHRILVIGTDRFLSGWGHAAGGASYAAWACKPDQVSEQERILLNRSDMERVRIAGPDYRPGPNCAHLHIYVSDVETA